MVAALALHEIKCLQQQLAIRVASRMDADCQLNDLASDRPNDVKRLRRQLQSASTVIQRLMDKLSSWLQHPELTRDLLSPPLQMAQDTIDSWALEAFQQGRFPWEEDDGLSETLSQGQLLSRLHRHLNQCERAEEELAILADECSNALTNYARQQTALSVAIQEHEDTANDCHQQSAAPAHSRDWHKGVCFLLRRQLQIVQRIRQAAQQAFGSTSPENSIAAAAACLQPYDATCPVDASDNDSDVSDM